MPRLQLVSLTGTKFNADVYEILLPTADGQIGVLADHMPLVSLAAGGAVVIRRQEHDGDDQLEYFAVSGGVIEIANNTVRVLVDEADHADDIHEAEAQAAFDRAIQLKTEAKDQISLEHAQELVDRTATRLHVASLKRRRTRA